MAKKLNLAKTFGGKFFLTEWILSYFPNYYEQLTYIEPYLGGGSVLLNKKPSIVEIANDIDTPTYCMWTCVRTGFLEKDLKLTGISYNEKTFQSMLTSKALIPRAVALKEYVLRNMSRSGMKKHFSWSDRERGGQPEGINLWENKLKNLPAIQARLVSVKFFNDDAVNVLDQFNTTKSLAYLDPPYLHETRTTKKVYSHEMSNQDHENLLDFLVGNFKGLAIISTYDNTLYSTKLRGWQRIEKSVKNNSGQNKKKSNRIEVLYKNF